MCCWLQILSIRELPCGGAYGREATEGNCLVTAPLKGSPIKESIRSGKFLKETSHSDRRRGLVREPFAGGAMQGRPIMGRVYSLTTRTNSKSHVKGSINQ